MTKVMGIHGESVLENLDEPEGIWTFVEELDLNLISVVSVHSYELVVVVEYLST